MALRARLFAALSAAFIASLAAPAPASAQPFTSPVRGEHGVNFTIEPRFAIGENIYIPAATPCTITVTLQNQEGLPAPALRRVRFRNLQDPTWDTICLFPAVPPFRGTARCTAVLVFRPPTFPDTFYRATIEVFPEDPTGDARPGNDTVTIEIFVIRKLPILVGSVLKVDPPDPRIGDMVVVTGRIRNIGFETAANPEDPDGEGKFFIRIFAGNRNDQRAERQLLPLVPGDSRTLSTIPVLLSAETTFFVVADPFSPTWASAAEAHETGLVEEAFDTGFNVAAVTLPLAGAPRPPDTLVIAADLVPERLSIEPDTAFGPLDTFTIRLVAANRGNTTAVFPDPILFPDSQNVTAFLLDNAGLAAIATETPIPVDSTYIVTAVIPPLGREGVFEIRAVVDALGNLGERSRPATAEDVGERNNAITRLLVVGRVPDLEVRSEEIEVETAVPAVGVPSVVRAKVRNVGDTPVANAVVEIYEGLVAPDPRDPSTGRRLIDRFVLPRLDAGASFVVEGVHAFAEAETHVVTVVADPAGSERERNESNNRATRAVFVGAAASDTRSIVLVEAGFGAAAPRTQTVSVAAGARVAIAGRADYRRVLSGGVLRSGPAAGVPVVAVDTGTPVRASAAGRTATFGEIALDLLAPSLPGTYAIRLRADDGTVHGETVLNLVVTGFVAGRTELLIDPASWRIAPDTPAPTAGESVTLSVIVTNVGTEPSAPVTIAFRDGSETLGVFGPVVVSGAAGGAPGSILAAVAVPAGLSGGLHRLVAEAAAGGGGDDLSNNVAETAVTVAPAAADLAIAEVRFDPVFVIEDREETVTVVVENRGGAVASDGGLGPEVRIVADGGRFDTVVRVTGTVAAFGGRSAAVVAGVVYARAGADTLLAVADPGGAVAQADRTNDSLLVSVAVRSDTIAPVAVVIRQDSPFISPENPGLHGESSAICWQAKDNVSRRIFATVRIEAEGTGEVIRTLRLSEEVAESPAVHCDTWDGRREDGSFAPQGRYRFAVLPSDPAGNVGRADRRVTVDNFGIEAEIADPADGATLLDTSGNDHRFDVRGTAKGANFESYALLALDSAGRVVSRIVDRSVAPVDGGLLGVWATDTLPSDLYDLLLVVHTPTGDTVDHRVRVFLSKAARVEAPAIEINACDRRPARGFVAARVLDARGAPVPTEVVRFSIPAPDTVVPAETTTGATGFTDTVAVVSGDLAGRARVATLSACVGGGVPVCGESAVRFVAGKPARIEIEAVPAEIRADGFSTTEVRVKVLDACGNAVEGETVVLAPAPETGTLAETTVLSAAPLRGVVYTAPFLRSDTAVKISARLPRFHPSLVRPETATIRLVGDAAELEILPDLVPDVVEVVAGETAFLRLRVKNLSGTELAGETVEVRRFGRAGCGALVVDGGERGDAFVDVTRVLNTAVTPPTAGLRFAYRACTVAGVETIVGTSLRTPGLVDTQIVRILPGPPARIDVVVHDTPRANRVDTARIEAAVFDTFGNPVPAALFRLVLDTTAFGGFDGPPPFGAVARFTGADGRETRVFSTTTRPGTAVVRAEVVADPTILDTALVVVVPPPPRVVDLRPARRNLRIDRGETTPARIVVTDEFGNPIPGAVVRIDTTGKVRVLGGETVVTGADGAAETVLAVLAGQAPRGFDTVVATVLGVTGVADTEVLCAVGAATSIRVDSRPVPGDFVLVNFFPPFPQHLAGLTVTLRDAEGCGVPGEAVRLRITDTSIVRPDSDLLASNDDGRAGTVLRWDTKAGTVLLVAEAPATGPPVLAETVAIVVKPGPIDTVVVAAVPSVVSAAKPDTSLVTAVARDRFGNGIPGLTLRFDEPNRLGTLTVVEGVTDTFGAVRTVFEDVGLPGTALVNAREPVSGKRGSARIRVIGDLAAIRFDPDRAEMEANGESCARVAVVALDSAQQPMPGETVTVFLLEPPETAVHPRGPLLVFGETTVVTGEDGRAFLEACAGTVAARVLVGAVSVRKPGLRAFPPLAVDLRPGRPARIDLVPEEETATANSARVVRFAAVVADTFGNAVPFQAVEFAYRPVRHLSIIPPEFVEALDRPFVARPPATETATLVLYPSKIAGEKRITATLVSDPTIRDTATLRVRPSGAQAIVVERRFRFDPDRCRVEPFPLDCPDIVVRRGEEGFLEFEVVDLQGNLVANERIVFREPAPEFRVGRVLVPDTFTDASGVGRLAFRGEALGREIVEIEAPDAEGVFRVIHSAQVLVVDGIPRIRAQILADSPAHRMKIDEGNTDRLLSLNFLARVRVFGTVEDRDRGDSLAIFLNVKADHPGYDTMLPRIPALDPHTTVVFSGPPESVDTGVWGIAPPLTDDLAQQLVDAGLASSIEEAKATFDSQYVVFTTGSHPKVDHIVTVTPSGADGCFPGEVFIDLDSPEPDTFRHTATTSVGNVNPFAPSRPDSISVFSMLMNDSGGVFVRRRVRVEIIGQENRPWLHLGAIDETGSFGRRVDTFTTDESGILHWRVHVNPHELIDSFIREGDTLVIENGEFKGASQRILDVISTIPTGAEVVCVRLTELQSGLTDVLCLGIGEVGGAGKLIALCGIRPIPRVVVGGCSTPVLLEGKIEFVFAGVKFVLADAPVEFRRTPARGSVLQALDGTQASGAEDAVVFEATAGDGFAFAEVVTGKESGVILVSLTFRGGKVGDFEFEPTTCTDAFLVLEAKEGIADLDVPDSVELVYEGEETAPIAATLLDRCGLAITTGGVRSLFAEGWLGVSDVTGFAETLAAPRPIERLTDEAGTAGVVFQSGTELRPFYPFLVEVGDGRGDTIRKTIPIYTRQRADTLVFVPEETEPVVGGTVLGCADPKRCPAIAVRAIDKLNRPVPGDEIGFSLLQTDTAILRTRQPVTNDTGIALAELVTGTRSETVLVVAVDSDAPETPPPKFPLTETLALFIRPGPVETFIVSVDPRAIRANGVDTAVVTVVAIDRFGNRAPRTAFAVELDVAGAGAIDPAGATGDDGVETLVFAAGQSVTGTIRILVRSGLAFGFAELNLKGIPSHLRTIDKSPEIVVAGEGFIEWQLLDQSFAPVGLEPLEALDVRGPANLAESFVSTDLNGRARARVLAETRAGEWVGAAIVVVESDVRPVRAEECTIPIRPDASRAFFTLTADSERVRAGGETTTLRLAATDLFGNPLAGFGAFFFLEAVDFPVDPIGASPPEPRIEGAVGAIDASGRAVATLVAGETAGRARVRASVDGVVRADTIVRIVAAGADTIDVAVSPDRVLANGFNVVAVTAVVRDRFGNGAEGEIVAFEAVEPSDVAVPIGSATTGETGAAVVFLTPAEPPRTLRIAGTAVSSGARDTAVLEILGPPDRIVFAPASVRLRAGRTAPVLATVVDAAGRGIPGETLGFATLDTRIATFRLAVPSGGAVSDGEGNVALEVVAGRLAGTTRIEGYDTNHPRPATGFVEVAVEAGDAARLDLAASPETFSLVARSSADLSVVALDADSNPVPGAFVEFADDFDLATVDPGAVTTGADGRGTGVLLRAARPARVTVTAVSTENPLQEPVVDTVVVAVLSGPPDTIVMKAIGGQFFGNLFVASEATVTDRAGNPAEGVEIDGAETRGPSSLDVGGAPTGFTDAAGRVAFDLQVIAGVAIGERIAFGAFLVETPAIVDTEIVFVAGDPARLEVTLADDLLPADGRSLTAITVRILDDRGNPVPGEDVALSLLRASDSAVVADPALFGLFDLPVTDGGDGTYASRYVAGTVPDTYAIRATVRVLFQDTFVFLSPDLAPPATPSGLRVADVDGFDTVVVAWDAVDPADVRRLRLLRVTADVEEEIAVLGAAETRFVDRNAEPGATHEYFLLAEDTVGNLSARQAAPAVLATSPDWKAQALVASAANRPGLAWRFERVGGTGRDDLEAAAQAIGRSLGRRSAYRLIPSSASTAPESITVRLKDLVRSGAVEAFAADADKAWRRADSQQEEIADTAVEAETVLTHTFWALLGDAVSPTAEITRPLAGAFVPAAPLAVEGTADDNDPAGFRYVLEARRGDLAGPVIDRVESASRVVAGPLGTLDLRPEDGPVAIHLFVEDVAGNVAEDFVTVTVDRDTPVVRIDDPDSGAIRGGRVEVVGEASDRYILIWRLTAFPEAFPDSAVLLGQDFASRFPPVPLGADLEPSILAPRRLPADGPYILRLVATDRAGRTAETTTRIVLDNTPPRLVVRPGDTTVGTGDIVTILAAVEDSNALASAVLFHRPIGRADSVAPLAGIVPATGTGLYLVFAPFDTFGTIPYQVTVTDVAGNVTVSEAFTITVVDDDSPVARFAVPAPILEGAEAVFDARASADSVGIVSYEWDFGDGATLLTAGAIARHTYRDEAGPLAVRLKVRDASGNSAETSAEVFVRDVRPAFVTFELVPPVFGGIPTFREGETAAFRIRFTDIGPDDVLFALRLTLFDGRTITIEVPAPADLAVKDSEYVVAVDLTDASPGVTAQAAVTELRAQATTFSDPIRLKVINDAPPAPVIDLRPKPARTRDDLRAVVLFQAPDPGGDPIQHLFEWSANGADTPDVRADTVTHLRTRKGDTWVVQVRAWDGEATSDPAFDTVVIANTSPDTPGVRIAPVFRDVGLGPEVLSAETMIGIVDTPALDPDVEDGVDTITYTYVWLRRGETQAAFTRSSRALAETGPPPEATFEGETWTLRVFATDGDDTSPGGEFTVTIVAPPVIEPPVPDTFVFRTQTLRYDLTPFETDEEDGPAGDGNALVWTVSETDPALFSAASVDPATDVLSMTARTGTGTDTVVLTLTDGRGLVDTQEVRVHVIAPEIDLKIDGLDTESVRRGPPGETATFVLTVENRAILDDLVAFSFTGIPAGWRARVFDTVAGAEVTGVALPPLAARSFALQVFVAPDAQPTTQGRIRVIGTAIDGITTDSAVAVVVVKAIPRVLVTSLTTDKASYGVGEAATIFWMVKNFTAEALNDVTVTTVVRYLGETVVLAETDLFATLISEQEVSAPKTVPGAQNAAAGTYVVTVTVVGEDTELPPLDIEATSYNVGLPAISRFVRTSQTNVVSPGAPGNGDEAKFDLDVTNGGAAARVQRLVEVRTPEETLVRTLLDASDTIAPGQTLSANNLTFTVTASDPKGQLNVIARLIRVSDSAILDEKIEVISNGAVRVNDLRFPGRGGAVPTYIAGETVTVEVEVENLLNSAIPEARIVVEVRNPFGGAVHRETSAIFFLAANGKPDTTFAFRLDTTAFQGTYRVTATVDSGGAPQHDRTEEFRVADLFTITEFRLRVQAEDRDFATIQEIADGKLRATFTVFNNLPATAEAFPRVVVTRPAGDTLVITSLSEETKPINGQVSAQWNNQPLDFATAGQGLYTFTLEIYDSAGPRVLRTTAVRFLDVVRFVRISDVVASPSRFHPRPSLNETTTISYVRQVFGDQNAVRAGGETVQIVRPADGAVMRTFFDTYEAYPFVSKAQAQKPSDKAKTWTRVWDGRDEGGAIVAEGEYQVRVIGLGGPVANNGDPMNPIDTHTAVGSVTVWGSHEGLPHEPPIIILLPGTFPPPAPPAPSPEPEPTPEPAPPAGEPPVAEEPAPEPAPAPTDTEPPVTTLTADFTDSTGTVLIPWSRITLTATDGPAGTASGVASTWLRIDGETVVSYDDPVTPVGLGMGLGAHTLGYASTDYAGNAEETRTFAFTVADPLVVSRRVDLAPRVLLWWNTAETPVARLDAAVAARAASLDTVTAAAEFVAGLRSGRYNLFMIVGKDRALTAAEEAEVAAHVDAGAGLVASVYDKVRGPALGANVGGMGQSARDNVLGVHVAGLNGNDLVVDLPAGPLAAAPATIAAPGRSDRVRVRHEAEILASFPATAPDSPAATLRRYGAGRALYIDFDIAAAVGGPDGAAAENLVGRAVEAAAPTEGTAVTEGGTVRLAIDVASVVVARDLDVNVEEILPAGYAPTSISPVPYAVQPQMIVWYSDLAPGETAAYLYAVEPPAGTSRPEAAVSYAVGGVYREQGRYGIEVEAASRASLAATAADSLAVLADAQASPSDRNALDAAAAEVGAIENAVFTTRAEVEAAIADVLDAIEAVTRTEDPDGRTVRDVLDRLAIALGREWAALP